MHTHARRVCYLRLDALDPPLRTDEGVDRTEAAELFRIALLALTGRDERSAGERDRRESTTAGRLPPAAMAEVTTLAKLGFAAAAFSSRSWLMTL